MNLIITKNMKIVDNIDSTFFDNNKLILTTIHWAKYTRKISKLLSMSKNVDDLMILMPYTLAGYGVYRENNNIDIINFLDDGIGSLDDIYYITNYVYKHYSNKYDIDGVYMLNDDLTNTKLEVKKQEQQPFKYKKGNKLLFTHAFAVQGMHEIQFLKKNEKFLKEYLEDGNILAMTESSGNNTGIPFIPELADGRPERERKLSDFYKQFKADPIQVTIFKNTCVGTSYDRSFIPYSWISDRSADTFIDNYLNYLKEAGIDIKEIYCLDGMCDHKFIKSLSRYKALCEEYDILSDNGKEHEFDKTPLCEFGYQKVLKK